MIVPPIKVAGFPIHGDYGPLSRPGRGLGLGLVCLALATASPAWAGKKPKPTEAPPLPLHEYQHPSGAFILMLPGEWTSAPVKGNPYAIDLEGEGFLLRLLFHPTEVGYDALHGLCMMERLQDDADLDVHYEYDYVGGPYGSRRALDSAFVVQYDTPVLGHTKWRQRNLTIVGGGQSLCLVANAPASVWKKSKKTRSLLEGVLGNVKFLE